MSDANNQPMVLAEMRKNCVQFSIRFYFAPVGWLVISMEIVICINRTELIEEFFPFNFYNFSATAENRILAASKHACKEISENGIVHSFAINCKLLKHLSRKIYTLRVHGWVMEANSIYRVRTVGTAAVGTDIYVTAVYTKNNRYFTGHSY